MYDRPRTQRALTFRSTVTVQSISVFNVGKGVLNWRASIEDPDSSPWLRFRELDEEAREITFAERSGAVATDSARLDLLCDRTGLPPGEYQARLQIDTNDKSEPPRAIDVFMSVLDLDGDYNIRAEIDTINGNQADTANPRLFMSLYRDRDGLKAIIDETRTLLLPKRLRLAGGVYQHATNKLIISGSLELPPSCPGASSGACLDNPYTTRLRRDFTLIADRRRRGNPHDAGLGPLDLKGEYRETLRGVLGDPIHLKGTFVANRVADKPSVTDAFSATASNAGNIPDGPDNASLERTFEVTEKLIITEVDVTVNLQHGRPADLLITLESPEGEIVTLRDRSTNPVGRVRYDEDSPTVDELALFNGERSDGDWTLRIEDTAAGSTGSFLDADLHVRGTEVHSIGGTVASVGAGAGVLLTGCGTSLTATTGANGAYLFEDLIDCPYRLTVHRSGLQRLSRDVLVEGADLAGIEMAPGTAPPDAPIAVRLPECDPDSQGELCSPCQDELCSRFTAITTAGGAGTIFAGGDPGNPLVRIDQLQYGLDAATFDLDRRPLAPGNPGAEDLDVFLKGEGSDGALTRTNGCSLSPEPHPRKPDFVRVCLGPPHPGNGRIDAAIGENAQHIFVAIGSPVIGVSTSTEGQLLLGAQP